MSQVGTKCRYLWKNKIVWYQWELPFREAIKIVPGELEEMRDQFDENELVILYSEDDKKWRVNIAFSIIADSIEQGIVFGNKCWEEEECWYEGDIIKIKGTYPSDTSQEWEETGELKYNWDKGWYLDNNSIPTYWKACTRERIGNIHTRK